MHGDLINQALVQHAYRGCVILVMWIFKLGMFTMVGRKCRQLGVHPWISHASGWVSAARETLSLSQMHLAQVKPPQQCHLNDK